MKQFIHLVKIDLKKVFRDKTMLVFLFTPIMLILAVKFGLPPLLKSFPELKDYVTYIMMFAAAQTAIMFGFITAFVMLDEKDENVITVIRVLPLNTFSFLFMRLSFAAAMSFLGALGMFLFADLHFTNYTNAILLSLQYALTAPFIVLVVVTFAKNKIEGMAVFKMVDLFLVLPVLSFLLTGWVKFLFGIVPIFWTFQSYQQSTEQQPFGFYYLIGLLIYCIFLFFLMNLFRKKVFDR